MTQFFVSFIGLGPEITSKVFWPNMSTLKFGWMGVEQATDPSQPTEKNSLSVYHKGFELNLCKSNIM